MMMMMMMMMMKIHRNLLVLGRGAVSPLGKESSSVNLFSPLISVFPVGIVHLNNGSSGETR